MESLEQRVESDFSFHPANTDEKRSAHTNIRERSKILALYLAENLPAGREQSMALSKLEEVMFWANAAIARSSDEASTES